MRIAIVSSLFASPGLGSHVRNLAVTLAGRGHDVSVFTRGRITGFSRVDSNGFHLVFVPFAPVPPFHLALHRPFLERALGQSDHFDVVNVHTPLCPPIRTRSPIVTTVHTPLWADITHEEEQDLRSRAGRLLARMVSIPSEKEVLRRSSLALATSHGVAADLHAMGVPSERVRVVGNGVDTLRFRPPEPGTRAEAEILYVGRLGTRKGLDHLISAFSQLRSEHPEARLRVIGTGPRRRALLARIRQMKLDGTVLLEGYLPVEEVETAYRRATCVVSPSLYEGLSTALLEAMASGAPVVATTVPGSIDLIQDGINGRLVPPKDGAALAEAVQGVLESPAEAAAMGRRARRTIEEGYTWDAITSRYEAAFDEAIGEWT